MVAGDTQGKRDTHPGSSWEKGVPPRFFCPYDFALAVATNLARRLQ